MLSFTTLLLRPKICVSFVEGTVLSIKHTSLNMNHCNARWGNLRPCARFGLNSSSREAGKSFIKAVLDWSSSLGNAGTHRIYQVESSAGDSSSHTTPDTPRPLISLLVCSWRCVKAILGLSDLRWRCAVCTENWSSMSAWADYLTSTYLILAVWGLGVSG